MLPFLEIGIVSIVIGIIGLSIARIFQWSKEQASDERTDNPQNWVLLELLPQNGYNPRFTEIFLEQWLKIGVQSLEDSQNPSLGLTFEVHSDGGQIHLYIKIHKDYAPLCQQMLAEAFPGMGVQEAVDPLLNWDKDVKKTVYQGLSHKSIFEVGLSRHSLFPVASHKQLANDSNLILDPFQILLLAFRDLPQDQYTIMQYCVSPATKQIDEWQSEYEQLHNQFLSRAEHTKDIHSKFLTKHEKDLLVAVKNKLSGDVFKTCIRCGVFASDPQKVKDTLTVVKLYLEEYTTQLQTLVVRSPQNIQSNVLQEESTSLISKGLSNVMKRMSKNGSDMWNQRFYQALLNRQIDSVDNRSQMSFSAEDVTSVWHIPSQTIVLRTEPMRTQQPLLISKSQTETALEQQPVMVSQEELTQEPVSAPAQELAEELSLPLSPLSRLRDYPEEIPYPGPVLDDYADDQAEKSEVDQDGEQFKTPLSQAIHELIKNKDEY